MASEQKGCILDGPTPANGLRISLQMSPFPLPKNPLSEILESNRVSDMWLEEKEIARICNQFSLLHQT